MNKLKSLFLRLKPESDLSKAILKTALVVLSAIAGLITLLVHPEVFALLVVLGVFCFIVLQIFSHFYRLEKKKGHRR